MFLQKIALTNFRNFEKLNLDFADVTLLIGDNAQGKSNILESIYFLATTKPLRVERDSQLIKTGKDFSFLSAQVDQPEVKLEIGISADVKTGQLIKRLKVNGIPRRVLDYLGSLAVVSFAPEDINLVSGSPALRRWHIDLTLAQVDRAYKRALTEYSEVITSRNRILKKIKEGLGRVDELEFWNGKACEQGRFVTERRRVFFDYINRQKSVVFGDFSFLYQTSEISAERLSSYQGREIAAGTTLIGPHRDDFVFLLGDKQLAFYGSRGEQRTAVLDLKLLEVNFISQLQDTKPVLLLDDVFSELDDNHRAHVIKVTKNQQTIISAVANENIPESFLESVRVVRVESGHLTASEI